MLYLVRWPNLSACIVRAEDEDDLIEMLDEVADPSRCQWSRYDGPLWVEFDLEVEVHESEDDQKPDAPVQAHDITFSGVEDFARQSAPMRVSAPLRVSAPGCDTGNEMKRAVLQSCFPKISKAIDELHERHLDLEVDDLEASDLAAVEAALRSELDVYIRDSWHSASNRKRRR